MSLQLSQSVWTAHKDTLKTKSNKVHYTFLNTNNITSVFIQYMHSEPLCQEESHRRKEERRGSFTYLIFEDHCPLMFAKGSINVKQFSTEIQVSPQTELHFWQSVHLFSTRLDPLFFPWPLLAKLY